MNGRLQAPSDEELFANDVLEKFAEGLAQGDHFSEILRGEVRSRKRCVRALTADLNDADHFAIGEKGCADNFLDRFPGFSADFGAFKHRGVARAREIIVDLRPALPRRAGRQRRVA